MQIIQIYFSQLVLNISVLVLVDGEEMQQVWDQQARTARPYFLEVTIKIQAMQLQEHTH